METLIEYFNRMDNFYMINGVWMSESHLLFWIENVLPPNWTGLTSPKYPRVRVDGGQWEYVGNN